METTMNEISKSFDPSSDEMRHLKLNRVQVGDRVVLIKDRLDIKVYVNNELVAQGTGKVPAFLDDVNKEFNGSFLADASIGENGRVDLIFYPRYISFSSPSINLLEEGGACLKQL